MNKINNPRSCSGSSAEVNNIVKQAKKEGLIVKRTTETVEIFNGMSTTVYRALKAHGFWIVRYDTRYFVDPTPTKFNLQPY